MTLLVPITLHFVNRIMTPLPPQLRPSSGEDDFSKRPSVRRILIAFFLEAHIVTLSLSLSPSLPLPIQ